MLMAAGLKASEKFIVFLLPIKKLHYITTVTEGQKKQKKIPKFKSLKNHFTQFY